MSLRELSQRQGAPAYKTLRNRCSAENWGDLRQQFRDNLLAHASALPQVQQITQQAQMLIEVGEATQRHAKAFHLAATKGMAAIERIDPAKLTVREALDLLKWGIEGERLIAGLSTATLDVTVMSDADLEHLVKSHFDDA